MKEAARVKDLVTVRKDMPFTTSLAIAEGAGMAHASVIKLIRNHLPFFEALGFSGFQIQKNRGTQGRETEYAEMTEDQATFLMTLFRNTDVVLHFKLRLVQAFRKALNEIARLTKQRQEPAWQFVRDETKLSIRWMNECLQESRAEVGKSTDKHHYMNEAKLIGYALTGIHQALDRAQLSAEQLALLVDVQLRNTRMIARGLSYAYRKTALRAYVLGNTPALEHRAA